MKVSEIMSKLLTIVEPEVTLGEAATLMPVLCRERSVPLYRDCRRYNGYD